MDESLCGRLQISYQGLILVFMFFLVIRIMFGDTLHNTRIVGFVACDLFKFTPSECLKDGCDVIGCRQLDHLHQSCIDSDIVEIRQFGRVDIGFTLTENGTNRTIIGLVKHSGQIETGFSS